MKHMLIDGKNCVYRAVFSARGNAISPTTVMFRFLSSYLTRWLPAHLHVFWEGASKKLWRKALLPSYKGDRKDHGFDVDAAVKKTQKSMLEILKCLNCRQYYRPGMEADDLIYAFCRSQIGEETLIVSSDGDFKQISHVFPSVTVYNPMNDTTFNRGDVDPLDVRCLSGDKSDTVPGYYGIGKKKAEKLLRDFSSLRRFFRDRGSDTYHRNRRILDLAMCPEVSENVIHVRSMLARGVAYDVKKIKEIIQRRKLVGLRSELSIRSQAFKKLG